MKRATEKTRLTDCACRDCCGASAREESGEKGLRFIGPKDIGIERWLETGVERVPVVSTRLGWRDRLGSILVRLGIKRMSYAIRPGLYAVGTPGPSSPVLVSANYKLSFDSLRKELDDTDAWILVLDTRGINVWCAAGKGTFGTEEILSRIEASNLSRLVSHRHLILPQLGAPGVAAHEVAKRSGFKVVYGPVRASDIKAFLENGMKASEAMRTVRFNLADRLILTPLELAQALKIVVAIVLVLLALELFGKDVLSWGSIYPYLGAIVIGTVVVPALLPWIPGRAFAWKGWLLGMAWAVFVNLRQGLFSPICRAGSDLSLESMAVSYVLLLPAISAFLAMNFTGSSTYTSLSGVLREMKAAGPAFLISASLGLIFLIGSLAGAF